MQFIQLKYEYVIYIPGRVWITVSVVMFLHRLDVTRHEVVHVVQHHREKDSSAF